mgnify:CR=1 FL=1
MTARAFGVPASPADPVGLGADSDFTEAGRSRVWFPASVILFLLAGPVMPARGQTLLREANNMGEIETTRLVVLGEVDRNEGFVSLPVDVARRKNGEWVVTDQITAEEVQLFSASGQWLRKIGREGAGPGESVVLLTLPDKWNRHHRGACVRDPEEPVSSVRKRYLSGDPGP